MPLDIPTGGGIGTGFIRFKPMENAWYRSSMDGDMEEFTWDSSVMIDIEKVELGWLWLAQGVREWIPWPENKQVEKPTDGEFKPAVSLKFYSKKLFGEEDAVRELCTSTVGVVKFVQALYADTEVQFTKHKGKKVPVVTISGSKSEKIGKGQTRIPQYTVEKFADRPDALKDDQDSSTPHVGTVEPQTSTVPDDEEF